MLVYVIAEHGLHALLLCAIVDYVPHVPCHSAQGSRVCPVSVLRGLGFVPCHSAEGSTVLQC